MPSKLLGLSSPKTVAMHNAPMARSLLDVPSMALPTISQSQHKESVPLKAMATDDHNNHSNSDEESQSLKVAQSEYLFPPEVVASSTEAEQPTHFQSCDLANNESQPYQQQAERLLEQLGYQTVNQDRVHHSDNPTKSSPLTKSPRVVEKQSSTQPIVNVKLTGAQPDVVDRLPSVHEPVLQMESRVEALAISEPDQREGVLQIPIAVNFEPGQIAENNQNQSDNPVIDQQNQQMHEGSAVEDHDGSHQQGQQNQHVFQGLQDHQSNHENTSEVINISESEEDAKKAGEGSNDTNDESTVPERVHTEGLVGMDDDEHLDTTHITNLLESSNDDNKTDSQDLPRRSIRNMQPRRSVRNAIKYHKTT